MDITTQYSVGATVYILVRREVLRESVLFATEDAALAAI